MALYTRKLFLNEREFKINSIYFIPYLQKIAPFAIA